MFEKIKNWASDNKEAIAYGAYCVVCYGVGIWVGKRIIATQMAKACQMNQSFHIDVPKEGARYLFNFGTEPL